VLSGESESLELEPVEEVQGDEHGELLRGETPLIQGVDVETLDGIGCHRHDGQVGEEPFETLVVGLAHELEQDSVVEDSVSLLPLAVLDVRPVFVVTADILQAVCVCLPVEHLE